MAKTYLHKRPSLDPCPIETVLKMVGGKWKARILYLLAQHELAFAPLRRYLGTISREVLITQLRALEGHGLITRRASNANKRGNRYAITSKGRELVEVLSPVADWGIRQLAREGLQWRAPVVEVRPVSRT